MIKRFYQVDSHASHRVGGTDGDFTFQIQLPLVNEEDKAGLCVVVTKASVQKSYDNVPLGFNTFTLNENGTNIVIAMPVGTYNAVNFASSLQVLLNAATRNNYTYTIAWQPLTGRYAISCKVTGSGNPGVAGTASFIVPPAIGFGIHMIMGMMADTTTALPFTSPNKVNYQVTSAVQLRSDMVSANDNVLAPIYAAETEYASSIVYQATDIDTLAKPLAEKNNGVFRFYITDVDGQTLNLNGGTVSFELLVYTPLAYQIRQFLKLGGQPLADDVRNYIKLRSMDILRAQEPDEKDVKQLADRLRANVQAAAATAAAPPPLALPPAAQPSAPMPDVKTADPVPEVRASIEAPPEINDEYGAAAPQPAAGTESDGDDMVVVSAPSG